MALADDLSEIITQEEKIVRNKVARFAYTEDAYNDNDADGVEEYDVTKDNNIPVGTPQVMKVNSTVVDRGYRSQASSITRMLMNHFLGRISYNLNKVNDWFYEALDTIKTSLGEAGGIATLDENGRIPFEQLPESSMTFRGSWDASTNTPTLEDGVGASGDFYVVSVAGTQTFGEKEYVFKENDRIIYDGSVWSRLASGSVYSVNNKSPDNNGNIDLTYSDVSAVPTSRTVNGKALSSNITLGASDVSAVPTTRTVNGHALSADVSVTKSDVGLGNVENTALSTWPGSNRLVTCNLGNFGSAATKSQTTSVTSGGTGLPTAGAVYTFVTGYRDYIKGYACWIDGNIGAGHSFSLSFITFDTERPKNLREIANGLQDYDSNPCTGTFRAVDDNWYTALYITGNYGASTVTVTGYRVSSNTIYKTNITIPLNTTYITDYNIA